MEKITINILDNNTDYRNLLVDYLQSYCKNYIINVLNTDDTKIDIESINESNALIVDEDSFAKIVKQNFNNEDIIAKTIVLTDSNSSDGSGNSYKYYFKRHSNIIPLITRINTMFFGTNLANANLNIMKTKIVLCMGLSGGSGTSTIAESIASQLVKLRESRVFYISLDTFESEIKNYESSKSQEKIMYSLLKNNFSNFNKIIENNVIETSEGIWRLPPSTHMNIIHELETEDKKLFINTLLEGKTFDYLVVDAGNQLNEFVDYFVQNSLDIILIDKNNSSKTHVRSGLLNSINKIKTENRECILVENFVMDIEKRTYKDAIPIKHNEELVNNKETDNMVFSNQIKNITDYIG